MPNLDDERMETYLKGFRPLAVDPLPVTSRRPFMRRPPVFAAWALATMVLAAVAVILVYRARRPAPVQQAVKTSAPAEGPAPHPLTLRNANELLARSPSYGAALDGIAFRHVSVQPPAGMKSGLEVLSKEESRL